MRIKTNNKYVDVGGRGSGINKHLIRELKQLCQQFQIPNHRFK